MDYLSPLVKHLPPICKLATPVVDHDEYARHLESYLASLRPAYEAIKERWYWQDIDAIHLELAYIHHATKQLYKDLNGGRMPTKKRISTPVFF